MHELRMLRYLAYLGDGNGLIYYYGKRLKNNGKRK